MSTRKVSKGEPWRPDSADDHNIKARAADAYRHGETFIPDRENPIDPCRIWIRNTSGGNRSQFQCLELDDAIVLSEIKAHKLYFDGITPTGDDIPFAVLLQPAPNGGGFRRGQVAGICPALVNVGSTSHTRAYLDAGDYVLTSSDTGPVAIVQQPGSTGEQLCVILFQAGGAQQIRRCCLAENHPGCGEVFNLKLGTWNPATDDWDYEATASAKGIDYWYSVAGPYPDAGATGNFIARPSDTYGTLWECVGNMSCDDDACGTCAEPA
jgi:hypothetical protein